MPIFVHSREMTQEFRRDHRRMVIRSRARKRREREMKPRKLKPSDLDKELDRLLGTEVFDI